LLAKARNSPIASHSLGVRTVTKSSVDYGFEIGQNPKSVSDKTAASDA
jgi:hypothetical protein